MKTFALAGLVVLMSAPWASAQVVYAPGPVLAPRPVFAPAPIAPVVSYSYYPPAPVYTPPVYTAPVYAAPVTTYYAPAPVAVPYGYSTTTSYGLGIFRPRGYTTQYYYGPYYR